MKYNVCMESRETKLLNKIPLLLNSLEDVKDVGKVILCEVKDIVNYDYAILYYLNENRATIKSAVNFEDDDFIIKLGNYAKFSNKIRSQLFNEQGFILDEKKLFVKELNLQIHNTSYLISKLKIKDMVYGFIVLIKKEENYYNKEDLELLDAMSSIVSYSIKDMELSNVFKLQLKALQDGILEKVEAYKKIKEQNEKIKEAERAKSEFFANMSHELRTPLTAIIGFSDSLKAEIFGKLNDKQMEYVKDINASSIHLLGMINEILDMTKIEASAMKLSLREISLNIAIQEVINIVNPLAEKKCLKLLFNHDGEIKINADYQKIQQVLFNLLSNAIKFSKENEEIKIELKNGKKEVSFSVRDNGIGIDKKYHGKVFAKFVQLENIYLKTGSSTGLGLTITKELVEMHKGRIVLESKVNKGSKFTVYLPKNLK